MQRCSRHYQKSIRPISGTVTKVQAMVCLSINDLSRASNALVYYHDVPRYASFLYLFVSLVLTVGHSLCDLQLSPPCYICPPGDLTGPVYRQRFFWIHHGS